MVTASLVFDDATIPTDLKVLLHWVCWRAVPNGDRIDKIPICASTGNNASSTDPRTWTTRPESRNEEQNEIPTVTETGSETDRQDDEASQVVETIGRGERI